MAHLLKSKDVVDAVIQRCASRVQSHVISKVMIVQMICFQRGKMLMLKQVK